MKKNLNEKLYRKIKSAVIRGINEAMDDHKDGKRLRLV